MAPPRRHHRREEAPAPDAPPPPRRHHRREGPDAPAAPPRRHDRREEAPAPATPAPTYQPSGRRHQQAAPPDEFTARRARRLAGPEPAPDRAGRLAGSEPAPDRAGRLAEPEPAPDRPGRLAEPEPAPDRARRLAESEPAPDRPRRRDDEAAGTGTKAKQAKKRRPRRRSVVAVLTSVVLALALAAGGVYWFELRREGLPPTAYARQACGAVRDWQQGIDSSNAKLINQISRQQNKTTVRSDVTAYYATIADRTDQLRVAILELGPADLTGGREYANSLAAAVGDQASGLRKLAGQASRLDPAAAAFPTDLQGILTGADAAVSAVAAALARPDAGITTELRTTLSKEPACVPYVG